MLERKSVLLKEEIKGGNVTDQPSQSCGEPYCVRQVVGRDVSRVWKRKGTTQLERSGAFYSHSFVQGRWLRVLLALVLSAVLGKALDLQVYSDRGHHGKPESDYADAILTLAEHTNTGIVKVAEQAAPNPESAALDAAMRKFTQALMNRNAKLFLSLFSRSRPWHYVGTITDPPQVSVVRYSELFRDFKRKMGWYETLFYAENLDCFRDHVTVSKGRMWKRIADRTFVPPDDEGDGRVYVKWAKERGRWVVEEIAEPAS